MGKIKKAIKKKVKVFIKIQNLLIVGFLSISLLLIDLSFSSYASALRVPIQDNRRIGEILAIPNTDIPVFIEELTDSDEIKDCLDKWFSEGVNRYFKRHLWDAAATYRGTLICLIDKDGKILGVAYMHKEKNPFWYSYDIKNWRQNKIPVYEVDLCEISAEFQRKKLGELLLAKMAEKILRDLDVKKKVLLVKPRKNEKVQKFYRKMGVRSIYIYFGDLHESEMFFYFILTENACRNLAETSYRRFVPISLRLKRLRKKQDSQL